MAYDRTKVQTAPGTWALVLEIDAPTEQVAALKAGRNRKVAKLSWFHMITTQIAPDRWQVKVAYVVEGVQS